MRSLPRWLLFSALVLVLVLASLASLAAVTVRSSFPQSKGSLTLPALKSDARVLRDDAGIPQIYADTPDDLFTAQGFVHAQDRFFEMDVRRHITSGRLAELFGDSVVETDAYIRTMGWRRVAEQEVNLMSAESRRYLDAYAAGVNAYLASRDPSEISLEYSVLGVTGLDYRPAQWTAADSLAWLKAMAWSLSSNREQEAELAVTSQKVGEPRAMELWPKHDPQVFDPIVPSGALAGDTFDPQAEPGQNRTAEGLAAIAPAAEKLQKLGRIDEAIPQLMGDLGEGGIGSNSWAVSGDRTASGKPILSNDPHLATSVPSIFSQVGLHCNTVSESCPFDTAGFSFAGMPGVVIGHNGRISWGFTTPYVDTQDYVVEMFVDGKAQRPGGATEEVQSHTEEIKVADGEPRTITVRSTSHGPILSDVDDQLRKVAPDGDYGVALSWTALTPTNSFEAIFDLNRASNFDEFRGAARKLQAPSQNLLYADVDGNIGYQLPGAIPVRRTGDGTVPLAGWESDAGWQSMVPFEALPYAYNPPQGYLTAANQQIVDPARYPNTLGHDYSMGWRSQQISDALNSHTEPLTMDQAQQIFDDQTVRSASRIVPALLRAEPTRRADAEWVADGKQLLATWDRRATADSAAMAYYAVVIKNVLKLTFGDELGPDFKPVMSDRWQAVLTQLLSEPDNKWWDRVDTPAPETRDDILAEALVDARREITVLMSESPRGWQWGKLHTMELRHETLGTSGIKPVEAIFNRSGGGVGGADAVVMAWGYNGSRGFGVTNGPTMRMLVDLSDFDNSRWVNQSGSSGHAFHRNYDDQFELIRRGEMRPWQFTRGRVEAAQEEELLLISGT